MCVWVGGCLCVGVCGWVSVGVSGVAGNKTVVGEGARPAAVLFVHTPPATVHTHHALHSHAIQHASPPPIHMYTY